MGVRRTSQSGFAGAQWSSLTVLQLFFKKTKNKTNKLKTNCSTVTTASQFAVQTNPHSTQRSAKSGAHPSAPPRACNAVGNATNELAKERTQDAESNRDHRLRPACAAEWNMACGASRALAAAKLRQTGGPLHLHPVTTQEFSVLPFSSRAREHMAPSILAAPGCAVPPAVRAHLSVILPNRAPKNNGSPDARTSMALSS